MFKTAEASFKSIEASSSILARATQALARATLAAAVLSIVATPLVCRAQAATPPEMATVSDIASSPIPGISAAFSRVTSGAEMLHLVVGHSLFLNTKSRLSRVYVADPNILNSVTLTPNQLVVTAMTSGISSLVLLDEAGQAQSYVVSSDVDIAGLRVAMAEAMRGDPVNGDPANGDPVSDDPVRIEGSGDRITLSGTVANTQMADTAVKLAGLYSKEVVNAMTIAPDHPKQVRLKVRILEIDRTKALQQGINLFNPGGNTSFLAATTTSQYPSTSTLSQSTMGAGTIGSLATSNPLSFMLYSSKLNLGTTIQDLESKQILQILAEPTITTISGETADFLSGGEFPFPMVQPGGTGSSPVVTITFRQYGVKLEFTPVVNADGTIRLKVAPEVSSLDYTNSVTIGGFTVPALSTRKAETQVVLRSGQSFAISGLLDQTTTDLLSKTPGIASIPILGALFKSRNINHSTTELVVIVTPTLVDPLTDTAGPAQPDLPIPTLNTKTFDKSLGKDANPHPAAPPINPGLPPWSNQVPAASPSSAPVTTPAATAPQDALPAQAAHSVPAHPAAAPAAAAPAAVPTATPALTIASAQPPSSAPGIGPSGRSSSPGQADSTASGMIRTVLAAYSPLPLRIAPRYVFDNPAASPVAAGSPAAQPAAPARSMVQVMALSNAQDAQFMAVALKRHGYNVVVNRDPTDSLLRLEMGPFQTESEAEAMRQRLLRDGYNATVR